MTKIILRLEIFGKFTNIIPFFMSQEKSPIKNDKSWSTTNTSEAMKEYMLSLLIDQIVKLTGSSEVAGNAFVVLEISDSNILVVVNASLSEHLLSFANLN